jgi:hypothetical protein
MARGPKNAFRSQLTRRGEYGPSEKTAPTQKVTYVTGEV